MKKKGLDIGRIRLSLRTVNSTYKVLEVIHLTAFRRYKDHSLVPILKNRDSVPTQSLVSMSPFLRFEVTSSPVECYPCLEKGVTGLTLEARFLYLRTGEYGRNLSTSSALKIISSTIIYTKYCEILIKKFCLVWILITSQIFYK